MDSLFSLDLGSSSLVALFTLMLASIIHRISGRIRLIRMTEKLPGPPMKGMHPWIGHTHTFWKTIGTIPNNPGIPRVIPSLTKWGREYDQQGLIRFWAFHPYRVPFARVNVLVMDPGMVEQVLTDKKHTAKLIKNQRASKIAGRIFGTSILTLPDCHLWKHQRKIVAQAFRQSFLEHANRVIAELLYGKVFVRWNCACSSQTKLMTEEMLEFSARMTAEVLGLVAFGHSFGGLDDEGDEAEEETLYETYRALLSITSARFRMPSIVQWFQFKDNAVFRKAANRLDSTISSIVKQRLAKFDGPSPSSGHAETPSDEATPKPDKDLLDYMIMEGQDGYKMPFDYLFGNTRMFLFAGHDTTAGSLAFAFWELAAHARVQRKLQAEIDALFDTCDVHIPLYKDIMKLPYLDACVRETLRLHPPVVVTRTLVDDMTLCKDGKSYEIPKGANVTVVPLVTQRRVASYPDQTLQFVPERFVDRSYGSSEWFPFSIGPRNCVGMPLAMSEMKTILAHVVRHYHLKPNARSQEPIPIILLTMRPHECPLDIERR